MRVSILGIGTALPPAAIRQEAAAKMAAGLCQGSHGPPRSLLTLYRKTAIRQRHSVLLEKVETPMPRQSFFLPASSAADQGPTTRQRMQRYARDAAPLAQAAARQALVRARLPAREVTHLITVSCTGFAAPGLDVSLIKQLGLRRTIGRTHIGFMGCHAALNALRIAWALAQADGSARVLLCAVELCSLHFSYQPSADRAVANALFSDGAAALIVAAGWRPAAAWRITAMGSRLFPDSEEAMTWRIGDYGFEMTLARSVPSLLRKHLRPWLEGWLKRHHLSLGQVRSWAVHPGGPRILSSIAACLDLPETALAASREVLAECGNMSSPTLLFVLRKLQALRAPRPCVALGFGPGLAAEAALFC